MPATSRKNIPIAVIALLIVGVGAFALYRLVLYPQAGTGLPKDAAVMGALKEISPGSIAIVLQDGTIKRFIIASTTQVVSQVTSGEVGKALRELAADTLLLVQPVSTSPTVAQRVTIVAQPRVSNTDPIGPPMVLSGELLSTTTNSITIKTSADPSIRILLTPETIVISNVLEGHKGKTLQDFMVSGYVQVAGVVSTKGIEARSIQLLVPLAP